MSLNVKDFDLFSGKTSKPVAKPVVAPMPVIKVETDLNRAIEKFDAEAIEELKASPVVPEPAPEPVKTAPVVKEVADSIVKAVSKTVDEVPLRKFETFVTPTFRIPEEHDFELKRIEHKIMRGRKKGVNTETRERITSNSVVRALIANFMERVGDVDLDNIDNEAILKDRLEKIFKQKYTKRS